MILAIDVFPQNDWQIVTADLPQYSSRYSNNTSILPDVMMGAVSRTAVANENHTDIAIIVLPAIKSDDLQNKKTRSKSQFTQISNNQDFKPGADVPVAFDNTNFQGDHANVKRDDTISNTATNFNYEGDMTTNNQGLSPAYVYVYGLTNSNINNLNASSTELVAPIGTKKKRSKKSTNAEERVEKIVELSPLELFVFDNCGMPYVAQELFGLSTPATSVQLSETSSERKDQTEQSSQQAHTLLEGGLYIREDCVVCLTEAKSVVLLPCR